MVPALLGDWTDRLVDELSPARGERVLDVACGTGIVARQVAHRVGAEGAQAGIDVSPAMLDVARAVTAGIRPAVDWHTGDSADLPFPDNSFDVVFCQHGLQFFPSPVAALREMHRVLVRDGRLGLAVWRPLRYQSGMSRMVETLDRHVGETGGLDVPFPDWDTGHLRALVTDSGFRDVHCRIGIGSARFPSAAEFVRQLAAGSPIGVLVTGLPAEDRTALVRDLTAALADYVDDQGLTFPMESYLVTARR
jgi:SAM-dependent methyltransferase